MKEALEVGHAAREKTASWQMLLPHIGELPPLTRPARNSSVRCCASATLVRLARTRASRPRAVLALIPVVHAREHFIGLMDGEHRAIGDEIQLPVGHHGGDLDDRIGVGFRPVISRSIQTR